MRVRERETNFKKLCAFTFKKTKTKKNDKLFEKKNIPKVRRTPEFYSDIIAIENQRLPAKLQSTAPQIVIDYQTLPKIKHEWDIVPPLNQDGIADHSS